MRVVLLVNSATRMGGVEHVARELLAGFRDAGHSAQMIGLWGEEDGTDQLLPRYVSAVSSLTRGRVWLAGLIPFDPVSALAHRDRLARRCAAKRLRTLVSDGPDVAFLAMSALTAQVLALASYRQAATLAQNHTSFEAMATGRDLATLSQAGNHLDRVLMLSKGDWEAFSARAPHVRGGYLRNPTPRHEWSERGRERTVVSLGRYEQPKDFELLLRAWARIASKVPGWRLDLYGSGRQGPVLRKLVSELGIADVAAVNGPTDDAGSILLKASLFALASRSEGMPLVILQAFAAGTPVVASRCSSGVEELLREGQAGWLVRPNDTEAFAATLLHAITDGDQRALRSKRARGYASHFSTARVVDDWLALFAEIQSEHALLNDGHGR